MSKRTQRLGRYEPIRVMKQDPDAVPSSFGYETESEVEFIKRQGLVLELRGTEKVVAGQIEADATHLVYMHGDDARAREITTEMWIRRTSKSNARLNIIWVRAVGTDGMEIELQCNERAGT